jgi:hypothetical protein
MTDRPTSSVWVGVDVVVGAVWLALAWLAVLLSLPAPFRGVAAAPLVFVLPGYALQLGLFAGRTPPATLERALLSVALSVAGTIAVGLALGGTAGITAAGSLLGLSALTFGGFAVAVARAPDRAFAPPDRFPSSVSNPLPSAEVFRTDDAPPAARIVWGVVVFAGVAGLLATGFLFAVHQPLGGATLALGSEDGSWNGSTAAVSAGGPVRVLLTHSYPGNRSFVVVALLQRPDGAALTTERRLDRFEVELALDERWSHVHRPDVDASQRGRLTYRLYRGSEATGDPRTTAHLWLGPEGGRTTANTAAPTRPSPSVTSEVESQ